MGREYRRIHLNLADQHVEWAQENNINLSGEVRDLLDERIQD